MWEEAKAERTSNNTNNFDHPDESEISTSNSIPQNNFPTFSRKPSVIHLTANSSHSDSDHGDSPTPVNAPGCFALPVRTSEGTIGEAVLTPTAEKPRPAVLQLDTSSLEDHHSPAPELSPDLSPELVSKIPQTPAAFEKQHTGTANPFLLVDDNAINLKVT